MNAKKEFLNEIEHKPKLKCANIELQLGYKEYEIFNLPVGFTNKQFDEYLDVLDFEYDDGYGGQNLFGDIWYEDGTWSERYEYDGSEQWDYKKCPEIPKELAAPDQPTKADKENDK